MESHPKRKGSINNDSEARGTKKARSVSATPGNRPTVKECESKKSCKYVVAIDFGTTFSGAAFAKCSDLESRNVNRSDAIHIHDNWPGQGAAGAKAYCKTLTSVWYMPGVLAGTFELMGWGWTSYVDYREHLQRERLTVRNTKQVPILEQHKGVHALTSSPRVSARCINKLPQKYGYFLTKFKLGLGGEPQDNLPEGLSLERVISDYLRELSTYVLKELEKKYGRDTGSHREIQYVLTVPAQWSDLAKQTMKDCAAMAGMVAGPGCNDNEAASPHNLIMVAEPEAAAVQVHKSLETTQFRNGDKFLVVDVGGGTTDLGLYEKIGSTTRGTVRVKASISHGALVGGGHVDDRFFKFLREVISCFKEFEDQNPRQVLEINRWWNDVKCSFDGSERGFLMPIPAKLARARKRFDRSAGKPSQHKYDDLDISSRRVESIFQPVVVHILDLIRQQLVPGLGAILVVGGFSESPYLRRKIDEAFKDQKAIFTPNGGGAVVRGAVAYGGAKSEWTSMVRSRVSTRTIGFDTTMPFKDGKHRRDYMVVDRVDPKHPMMCDNIFRVIIKRGQEIPLGHVVRETFKPIYRVGKSDNDLIQLNLYETRKTKPLYVTDEGVKKVATASITVPGKGVFGREPKLKLSVHFGTLIEATVEGENFRGKKVTMPPISIKWAPAFDSTS